MSSGDPSPDVDALTRSMLLLQGFHDDDHAHSPDADEGDSCAWSKAPDYADDPQRAVAVRAATRQDRERYLTAGLTSVDCRFCHASVQVKKLGSAHTAVQWNADAQSRCAYFTEIRASDGQSARVRACPKLSDSITHAIAEGCLEEYSSASPPGDG